MKNDITAIKFLSNEVRLVQCLFAADAMFRSAAKAPVSDVALHPHFLTQAEIAMQHSRQVVAALAKKYKVEPTVIAVQLADAIDRTVLESEDYINIVYSRIFTNNDPIKHATFDRLMLMLVTILDMHLLQERRKSCILLATN